MNRPRIGPVLAWLFPPHSEADEGFNQEILSLAHRGLKILAGAEVGLALLGLTGLLPVYSALVILGVGLISIAAVRSSAAYAHNRWIGVVSASVATIAAARGLTIMGDRDFALGAWMVLVFTASGAMPLLPLQSLTIGLAGLATSYNTEHWFFLVMLALVAVAISGTLYAQRRANYDSYLTVVQATQDFRALQARLLVAENSSTMGRLSAALAHELSQPVGTVGSGIDTLLTLSARAHSASPGERERLMGLETDLAQSLKASLERLRKMVNRIQRLTDLDEAGSRKANVNELIQQAAEMVRSHTEAALHIEFNLKPVPDLECRPQQLIAVFGVLITNSIQATSAGGHITISTQPDAGRVEVRITDDGRGIPLDRLPHIFEPGFEISDGRVGTGNWSLFTSRQLIKDHGGEMRIHSREGEGTTVSLILPCLP